MKARTIFASAAIIATLASQNAQVVAATTEETQNRNANNTVVDKSDNGSNLSIGGNDDSTIEDDNDTGVNDSSDNTGENNDSSNTNDKNDVVNDDNKTNNNNTNQNDKPVVKTPRVKAAPANGSGTIGPGAYDNKTIKLTDGNDVISSNVVNNIPISLNAKEFFKKISDGAIEGWHKYKVLPSVTMAQAAIESGWGASGLTSRANNLFGIKGSYDGQFTVMATQEQDTSGNEYWVNASFREYPSWKESLEDHGKFLQSNSRYHNLLGKKDYKEVTALLKQDGYATAVNYSEILNKIIETYDLTKYDDQAFNGKTGNDGEENNISGTAYISNTQGAQLVESPDGETIGRTLKANTNWKIDRIYTKDNQTWYRVGRGTWVKGTDVTTGKATVKKPTSIKISGIRTVKNSQGAQIFSSPIDKSKKLNHILPKDSSWKIDRVLTIKGKTWYRVGKSQWINQSELVDSVSNHIKEADGRQPSETSGVKTITNENGGKLYSSPFSDGKYLGKTLSNGTSWKVDQVIYIKGITWYRVGKDMWINNTAWDNTKEVAKTANN